MKPSGALAKLCLTLSSAAFCFAAGSSAYAADQQLLDMLLQNGALTPEQYDVLMQRDTLTSEDFGGVAAKDAPAATPATGDTATGDDSELEDRIAAKIADATPVVASHGSSGFRLETRDGNWQTNLQWRAQFRYTNPTTGDPRQLGAFDAPSQSTFEARRLRMKIGGHGFQPWLKYYFEVDLQPSRDVDAIAPTSSARVIDWRADVAKWAWGGLRVGQWKIDYNRERVDSSGRQQFVERSIVNRVFTIDRQVGIQLRGHAFESTPADLRWYAGVFTGEGRGVRNADNNLMYVGRLQWNFLGRDLALRQTDVEYTELPTASLALAGATTTGTCTRWSSGGCGSLDGFTSPVVAAIDQFEVEQAVQEFAYKYRGLSIQQEFHRKWIADRQAGAKYDMTGGYIQSGYFFHNLVPAVPAPLELAVRYAFVDEPNAVDRSFENSREEVSLAANWFFSGHNNKLTLDVSHLNLDNPLVGRSESENRVRFQWDVSF